MSALIVFKVFLAGFTIAAPYGPMAVVSIHQSLKYNLNKGLAIGVGCVAADVIYAAVALIGLSWVSEFIHQWQHVMQLIGGAVLILLGGLVLFYEKQSVSTKKLSPKAPQSKLLHFLHLDSFAIGFMGTIMHPGNLAGVFLIFAALGVGHVEISSVWDIIILLTAFLVGGCLIWFLVLEVMVKASRKLTHKLRHHVDLSKVQAIVGFGLIAVGLFVLLHTGFDLLQTSAPLN